MVNSELKLWVGNPIARIGKPIFLVAMRRLGKQLVKADSFFWITDSPQKMCYFAKKQNMQIDEQPICLDNETIKVSAEDFLLKDAHQRVRNLQIEADVRDGVITLLEANVFRDSPPHVGSVEVRKGMIHLRESGALPDDILRDIRQTPNIELASCANFDAVRN